MEIQQILEIIINKPIFFILGIAVLGFTFYKILLDRRKRIQLEKLSMVKYETLKEKKIKKDTALKENVLNDKLSRLESLREGLEELKNLKPVEVSDYKNIIEENQSNILQKGNDEILFSFLKIFSFLNDYKQGMELYKNQMTENINLDLFRVKLIEDSKQNNSDKLNRKRSMGFDYSFDNLVSDSYFFKDNYENYNKTLGYYKNIAMTMVVFYLNDNKVSYFEIHQAFEKLGVFDSTWQKNLMSKISNIETNLSNINDNLSQMNYNFEQLINQSEKITNELKGISGSVQTGNMIQAISAYQSWRINRKIDN